MTKSKFIGSKQHLSRLPDLRIETLLDKLTDDY